MKRISLFLICAFALAMAGMAQQVSITPEFQAAVAKYDIVQTFHNGYAAVCRDGKWGYIDTAGREVIACTIPAKYDVCSDRADYGFYRDNGYVRDFSCGLVAVAREVSGATQSFDRQLKWGYMDATGRLVVDYIYDDAADFSEGLAYVACDTYRGYIDTQGNRVIDVSRYDDNGGSSHSFHNGLALVAKANDDGVKFGYIDHQGREVVPCTYDDAQDYSEGLASVGAFKEDDADDMFPYVYSFINVQGQPVFTLKQGLKPGQFHNGMASVTTDARQYGFIDTTGTQVVPMRYATAEVAMERFMADFNEDFALVGDEATMGDTAHTTFHLLGKNGVLSTRAFDSNVHQGLVLVDDGSKFGFARPDGTIAIPCQYDYTQPCVTGELLNASYVFNEGVAAVRKAGHWGYIDAQGNSTFK